MFPKNISVEEIVRAQNKIPVTNQSIIQKDDQLLIAGKVSGMIKVSSILGQEIDTEGQNDLEGQTVSIWITNKNINGLKLSDLLSQYGKGVFVLGVTRQGHDIPKLPSTLMHRGDTIEIMGSKTDVDSAAKLIGYPEIPTSKTDLVFVSLGIIGGTLLGLLSIKIGNASLGFGIGGGVLIIGLVFGWLRSFHPTFGFIPSSAQWLMQDLGLNLFIAVVGLIAGPNALSSLKTAGGNVIIAGFILALIG
jgi:putative transport protein